jgi:hypothetical protein
VQFSCRRIPPQLAVAGTHCAPAGHGLNTPFAKTRFLKQNGGMASETFKASRWTRGNHLFRTVIEVTDQAVIRHKRSWFSKDEISISISKVASVHIKTGIIWSDILIESSGGTDPLASHGHSKADAQRIRALVEAAQGIASGPEKLKSS